MRAHAADSVMAGYVLSAGAMYIRPEIERAVGETAVEDIKTMKGQVNAALHSVWQTLQFEVVESLARRGVVR